MEIQKVKITKDNTCVVTYSNADGDVIIHQGGNIIHKDLREAMNALIPHLAILTEQREAYNRDLTEVRANEDLPLRLFVFGLNISGDSLNTGVAIIGQRNLASGKMLALNSPVAMLDGDTDVYQYADDLFQLVENVKYEVREYVEQRKWAVKQGELFENGDGTPFADMDAPIEVESVDIPQADMSEMEEEKPKKKKSKKVKAAA